jgi:hypothetical protein
LFRIIVHPFFEAVIVGQRRSLGGIIKHIKRDKNEKAGYCYHDFINLIFMFCLELFSVAQI